MYFVPSILVLVTRYVLQTKSVLQSAVVHDLNAYTWNFGKYDKPSERQEFNLYGSIC